MCKVRSHALDWSFSTWPSSSFRFEVRALAGVFVSESYISLSYEETRRIFDNRAESSIYRIDEISLNKLDQIHGDLQRDRNQVVEQNEEREESKTNMFDL